MKFAIFEPTVYGGQYVKSWAGFALNWEDAELFLTREDAQAYIDWLKKNKNTPHDLNNLIIRQVE